MDREHERYESLAVGHVLGGLVAPDAAEFRTHLLGCRDCRLRVAELRDIAADLAAAEREERAEARVRTEIAAHEDEGDGDGHEDAPAGPRLTSIQLGVAITVVGLMVAALAFWNLHLRTQVAVASSQLERLEATVTGIAGGVAVEVELAEQVGGVVVVDGERVAFSFVGLPALERPERAVVWLVGVDGEATAVALGGDAAVSGTVDDEDASELVVTVEDVEAGAAHPGPRQLARAELATPLVGP